MTKSSAKFLPNRTEPNLPKSAEPRSEPNRNFGRFLIGTKVTFESIDISVSKSMPPETIFTFSFE